MSRAIGSLSIAILFLIFIWWANSVAAASLESHQGKYFRWLSPPRWLASETSSGMTLTSPDGRYSAGLASVLRSRGTRTPRAFLEWTFTHVPDYANVRIVSVTQLPGEQLHTRRWDFIEAVVSYTDKGLPVTGVWKVGVSNYSGMNDAVIVGYRAANPDFHHAQSFMPVIAKSIVLTNGTGFAGNDTIVRPKNNPLDNSGLIRSGQKRDAAREHASEAWREGMMGTEPTVDPKTGTRRDTPLGDYNPARGGYVNPERPDELLDPDHK